MVHPFSASSRHHGLQSGTSSPIFVSGTSMYLSRTWYPDGARSHTGWMEGYRDKGTDILRPLTSRTKCLTLRLIRWLIDMSWILPGTVHPSWFNDKRITLVTQFLLSQVISYRLLKSLTTCPPGPGSFFGFTVWGELWTRSSSSPFTAYNGPSSSRWRVSSGRKTAPQLRDTCGGVTAVRTLRSSVFSRGTKRHGVTGSRDLLPLTPGKRHRPQRCQGLVRPIRVVSRVSDSFLPSWWDSTFRPVVTLSATDRNEGVDDSVPRTPVRVHPTF